MSTFMQKKENVNRKWYVIDAADKPLGKVVELAIKGMLPHNSIGSKSATRLKVFKGAEHKHEAQKPQPYEF